MRSSSLRTHGGHVAGHPIHDAHQITSVIHILARARAARPLSVDMRSSSLRTHGGHVAVQPIHDAHQLEHVIHIVVRAGLLGLERVAVTREYGLHAEASPPDDTFETKE